METLLINIIINNIISISKHQERYDDFSVSLVLLVCNDCVALLDSIKRKKGLMLIIC